MTKLHRLFTEFGQSPWLDNLTRQYLRDPALARMVPDGIRGITANPTILARAIEGSELYDEQFRSLVATGFAVPDAYWELAITDIHDACALLRPTFAASNDTDGFVSIEVAPELARNTLATIAAARGLHQRIAQPNLLVKIPATAEGIPAIKTMISEGRNINVTLIFSLSRYTEVIEAYLSGLEAFSAGGGDLCTVHSVASFFVSRVDSEVNRRLDGLDRLETRELRGGAAVAQAKLAYQLFRERFSDQRWQQLAARGAHAQRPLWASTSTKDPSLSDTFYVDNLIGPDTVTTLPEATIAAFEHHGSLARTLDADVDKARDVIRHVAAAGIDLDDVGLTLERNGVETFHESFQRVLGALDIKAARLVRR